MYIETPGEMMIINGAILYKYISDYTGQIKGTVKYV